MYKAGTRRNLKVDLYDFIEYGRTRLGAPFVRDPSNIDFSDLMIDQTKGNQARISRIGLSYIQRRNTVVTDEHPMRLDDDKPAMPIRCE